MESVILGVRRPFSRRVVSASGSALTASGRLDTSTLLVGQVEVFGIGILEAGFVAGLPGQPLKEPFQVRECGVPSRLAQMLAALLAPLCGQPAS